MASGNLKNKVWRKGSNGIKSRIGTSSIGTIVVLEIVVLEIMVP